MDNDTIGYIVLFVFWLLSQLASQAKKKPTQTRTPRTRQEPSRSPEVPPLAPPPAPEAPARGPEGLDGRAAALSERLEQLVTGLGTSSDDIDDKVGEQVAFVLSHGLRQEVEDARAALDSASASQDRRALSRAMERGVTLESTLQELQTTARTHTSLRRRPETRAALAAADRLLEELRAELVPFFSSSRVELAEPPPVAVIWDLGADDRLSRSPLAGSTLFLPRSLASELLHWTFLPYELARYLGDASPGLYREIYDRLGLAVSEPNVVANPAAFARLLFASYIVRLLGDATGASLFGPAYLVAVTRTFQRPQSPPHVTTVYLSQDGTIHPEPPAHLRVRWTARWLSEMGHSDEADETLHAWKEKHLDPQELYIYGSSGALPLAPLVAEMDALTARLYRLEAQTLGGRQLAELPGLADWGVSERTAAVARQALARGELAAGPARALIASAMAAAENAPADADARVIRRALYDSLGGAKADVVARRATQMALPIARERRASVTDGARPREIAEALVLADVLLERPQNRRRFAR